MLHIRRITNSTSRAVRLFFHSAFVLLLPILVITVRTVTFSYIPTTLDNRLRVLGPSDGLFRTYYSFPTHQVFKMRLIFSLLAATALVTPTISINLGRRTSQPRVIGLDIARSNNALNIIATRKRLAERQNVVSESLDNEQNLYYADVTVGTPQQTLRLPIDTGSSDMWTNIANSTLCSSASNVCQGGTYDPTSSSTYRFINNNFNISYVDGTGSVGDYVSDTIYIAGTTLPNFQFGVGLESEHRHHLVRGS